MFPDHAKSIPALRCRGIFADTDLYKKYFCSKIHQLLNSAVLAMNFFVRFLNQHRLTLGLAAGVLLVAWVVSQNLPGEKTDTDTPVPSNPTVVSLTTASSFADQSGFTVLGDITATNRALVTTEVGGQIASIRVNEGDVVAAGTLIATLKNESQQAAVAQAEAAVAAAEAGAAQSDVGTANAESTLAQAIASGRTAVSSSYSTAQRVVLNDVDRFFSRPQSGVIGSRVGSGSLVSSLNEQRVALRDTLPAWERLASDPLSDAAAVEEALETSQTYTNDVLRLVNTLITAIDNESPNNQYSATDLRTLQSQLTQSRETLLNSRSTQQNALAQITSSRNSAAQAAIGGTTGSVSSAQAQIDQARANLRSAQAQLNNTYLRAPIAGTIDNFDLTLGQFVAGGTTIAEVTNQSALEITAYVTANERQRLQVNDEVELAGGYSGIITNIAPAADSATGKIPVTITAADAPLTIGGTVPVTFPVAATTSTDTDTPLQIPINAIRFSGNETAVMQVDSDNTLYTVPVTLGETTGNVVTVLDGISSTTPFVLDVRGTQVGDEVTVERN